MRLQDRITVFAPAASAAFGDRVASCLGVPLCRPEEREFDDGEYTIRSPQSVRGRSIYVIQCLRGDAQGSVDDRLCRLLFFVGALKDAGADRVTLCLPYLAYARKDQRTKARDPITLRYVAQMMEAVGTDRALMYSRSGFIWLTAVLLLYWISHAWLTAHRGRMTDDPLVFAVKDPTSVVLIILMGVSAWVAV